MRTCASAPAPSRCVASREPESLRLLHHSSYVTSRALAKTHFVTFSSCNNR